MNNVNKIRWKIIFIISSTLKSCFNFWKSLRWHVGKSSFGRSDNPQQTVGSLGLCQLTLNSIESISDGNVRIYKCLWCKLFLFTFSLYQTIFNQCTLFCSTWDINPSKTENFKIFLIPRYHKLKKNKSWSV